MLPSTTAMDAEALYDRPPSLADVENRLALGAGALLLLVGASRRSPLGTGLAVLPAPLQYRGVTGRWPDVLNGYARPDSTKSAVRGDGGVHVRESIRLEVPVVDVHRFWRHLEHLPQFMTHLDCASEASGGVAAPQITDPLPSRQQ